ncbi:unnamed protein product [Dovyalis caffra]|uniref:Uncharacterized protein n=1 Tax=Dovyalis caffra TaxID=77055 RepID=A0AAV1RDM6_9ROSI|nr:unnamed protein product [Dovyalis caffra]
MLNMRKHHVTLLIIWNQPHFGHHSLRIPDLIMQALSAPLISHSPYLRYIHRFLSISFYGTIDDSSREHSIKINLTGWLGRQFFFMVKKKRGNLCLGSMITFIVVKLGVLDMKNTNMHIACEMKHLDLDYLHKMGVVFKDKKGTTT